MPQSAVYISTASRDALREIARKHFKKESEILEKLPEDNLKKFLIEKIVRQINGY